MESLEEFFEREIKNMKVHCFKKLKQKKYKKLALKLSAIPENHKKVLLKEYFLMCKTMFLIRSTLAY